MWACVHRNLSLSPPFLPLSFPSLPPLLSPSRPLSFLLSFSSSLLAHFLLSLPSLLSFSLSLLSSFSSLPPSFTFPSPSLSSSLLSLPPLSSSRFFPPRSFPSFSSINSFLLSFPSFLLLLPAPSLLFSPFFAHSQNKCYDSQTCCNSLVTLNNWMSLALVCKSSACIAIFLCSL